jgi:hypothetical protein
MLNKHDEINRLKDELKILEANNRDKSFAIEKLSFDNETKSEKLEKSSAEIAHLKSKCDSLEREVESFKYKLSYDAMNNQPIKLTGHDSTNISMLENEV